jgi:hypothetical protein
MFLKIEIKTLEKENVLESGLYKMKKNSPVDPEWVSLFSILQLDIHDEFWCFFRRREGGSANFFLVQKSAE